MKPLSELIKSVDREIRMRQQVYPPKVRAGEMKAEKADHEIQCMKDIKSMLEFKSEQELGL